MHQTRLHSLTRLCPLPVPYSAMCYRSCWQLYVPHCDISFILCNHNSLLHCLSLCRPSPPLPLFFPLASLHLSNPSSPVMSDLGGRHGSVLHFLKRLRHSRRSGEWEFTSHGRVFPSICYNVRSLHCSAGREGKIMAPAHSPPDLLHTHCFWPCLQLWGALRFFLSACTTLSCHIAGWWWRLLSETKTASVSPWHKGGLIQPPMLFQWVDLPDI